MSTNVSATKARVHFGDMIEQIEPDTRLIVEHGGDTVAVVVSIEEYEQMRGHQRKERNWRDLLSETHQRFRGAPGGQVIDIDRILQEAQEDRDERPLEGMRRRQYHR